MTGTQPLLERDAQLAALMAYAEGARAVEGRMVLVSGEAGGRREVGADRDAGSIYPTPDGGGVPATA